MAACRRLIGHDPRIIVTGIEAGIGTRYTQETIAFLKQRAPLVRFVWLMGSDNLASFHRWQKWRDIAAMVPMAVIDRPGTTLRAVASPAARTLAAHRLGEEDASGLATREAPAWVFLHGRRSGESSTRLRSARQNA